MQPPSTRPPARALARALLATVVAAAALPATIDAASAPGAGLPRPCPPTTPVRPATAGAGHGGAWYRLAPALDAHGRLMGRSLVVGIPGAPGRRLLLPPESFASGPVGGVIVAGADDGRRSSVVLLAPGRRCATHLPVPAHLVVRSAILDPGGTIVAEHRVDRRTRADRGIWERPVAGGPAHRVLGGARAWPTGTRTFATILSWTSDGRLAVASCGEISCRIRLLDRAARSVLEVAGTGPQVDAAGDRLIAAAVCDELPCPLVEIDLRTGGRTLLPGAAAGNPTPRSTDDRGLEPAAGAPPAGSARLGVAGAVGAAEPDRPPLGAADATGVARRARP